VEGEHASESRSRVTEIRPSDKWHEAGPASSVPRLDRRELAAIFAGGFLGTIVRAALAQGLAEPPDRWPWATFIVNIVGAFLLGFFVTRLQERLPPSLYRRAFLGAGICGALTTFSTMMVELLKMIEGAHWALTAGYAAASIGCGLAAVFVSTKLVRRASVRA
jgi:fluoride exporter